MADPALPALDPHHKHQHGHRHVNNDDPDSTPSSLDHEQDGSSYHSSDDEPPYDSDQDYEYEYHPASEDPVSHLVVLDMTSRVKRRDRRNPPPPSPPPPPRKRRTNRQRQGLDPTDDDDDDANNQDDDYDEDNEADENDENDGSNDSDQSSPREPSPREPSPHEPSPGEQSPGEQSPDEQSPVRPISPLPAAITADAAAAAAEEDDDDYNDDDSEEAEDLQRRRNALQVLDFASAQPLVSDHRRIYAMTWGRALGTDLLFSVPNAAEGESYRPQFLGTTRVRLIAQPLRPRPRGSSPRKAPSRNIWARAQAELALSGDTLFNDIDIDTDDSDDSLDEEMESSIGDYFGSGEEDSDVSTDQSISSTYSAPDDSGPLTPEAPNLEPDQPTAPAAADPTTPQDNLKRKRPQSPEPVTHALKRPRVTAPVPIQTANAPIPGVVPQEHSQYLPLDEEETTPGPGPHEGRGAQLAAQRRDTLFGEFTNGDAPGRPHGVPRRLWPDAGDAVDFPDEAGDDYGEGDGKEGAYAGRDVSPDLVTALEEGAGFADPDSDAEAVMSGGRGLG